MAEALALIGLASAIVQFVDFSTKVIGRIDRFRSKNNEVPVVFRDIKIQLPLLISGLKRTKERVERHEVALETQSAVLAVVQSCHAHVIALDEILLKILPYVADSFWRRAKKALLSVHQEDKIRFIAHELRNNVIYLTHHSVSVTAQRDNISRIPFIQADEQMKMMLWLISSDHSIYHNRAIQQREPGTGQWILKSDEFVRWKTRPRGLWWLHGIPGCGKTLLCAAIVEEMKDFCKLSESRVMAYYYFDFNDSLNANVRNILRSLIIQICVGTDRIPKAVQTLCSQHRASGQQPSIPALLSILRALEASLSIHIFIIIDALDECPEHQRPELLSTIQSLVGKDFENTHILATSRAEHDIKLTLGESATDVICIENDLVDADIKLHVRRCLSEDPRLSRLPGHIKNMIELKLGEDAQGALVDPIPSPSWLLACRGCLSKMLTLTVDLPQVSMGRMPNRCSKILGKPSAVKMILEDLPRSLYDTYERILSCVSSSDLAAARAILRWIALAKRPLARKKWQKLRQQNRDFKMSIQMTDYMILTMCFAFAGR